jgi:hypothetical protein
METCHFHSHSQYVFFQIDHTPKKLRRLIYNQCCDRVLHRIDRQGATPPLSRISSIGVRNTRFLWKLALYCKADYIQNNNTENWHESSVFETI